jgi:hypothetical protein
MKKYDVNTLKADRDVLIEKLNKRIPSLPFRAIKIDHEGNLDALDGELYLYPDEAIRLTKALVAFYLPELLKENK